LEGDSMRGWVPKRRLTRLRFCVAIALAMLSFGAACAPDIEWKLFDWDGLQRTYGLYVPAGALGPAPLVFLFHGGGGSARKTWAQEHGRSWRALADEHGFVLVLPEARPDPDDSDAHHWNDCRADVESATVLSTEDDVGFIVGLMDVTSEAMSIGQDRVYATGASNGGMMTYRLAIEAGDRFAAVAAVIANLPDPSECETSSLPIPMLIMNGTDDPLIPFEGGCVAGDRCERGRVLSTAETIAFWVDVNGASTEPTVEKLPNRSWFDGSRVTVFTYVDEIKGADVVYYHIQGGGHTVPGFESASSLLRAVAGPKNRDIDGPTEIWAFFEEHPSSGAR
jgi:polyhydroxybutyrate depolymerase